MTALLAVGLLGVAPAAAIAADPTTPVSISAPRTADLDRTVAVTVKLAKNVAAIDGRVLVRKGAAEVLGVAPAGPGTAFRPVEMDGGAAFGAYDLGAVSGSTTLNVVLVPQQPGHLQVRLIVDAASDADGKRVKVAGGKRVVNIQVAGGSAALGAPDSNLSTAPKRAAGAPRDLMPDGRFDSRDVAAARAGWEDARLRGTACASPAGADANDDGCTDIVDVQSMLAVEGERPSSNRAALDRSIRTGEVAAADEGPDRTALDATLTVNSTADTPDVAPGNGVCATSTGTCTLRAAMMEADALPGDDRIHFNLLGVPPVRIQVTGNLPLITERNGTMTIDGYTQPGSRVNTAEFGSNAIPGVEIRGNGNAAREILFRIFSPGNTIRGLLINNAWRSISPETVNANNNYIIGNWLGFTATGGTPSRGQFAIVLNTGAHHNFIGTPALADRNVIGNHSHAIENYGPGVDFNTIQNNLLCIGPTGLTTARCDNGIDHNFGPKSSLIGGTGPNERNIIGPTSLQCIEFSHGWDPAGNDTSTRFQINGHRVIGNWVGFRGNGSYNALYRCGLNDSSADNAQAINVYDGSNNNLIEGNTVGSVYDGIQFQSSNANSNIARGNIIGVSPLGEPAPLARWGVMVRLGTRSDIVEGNTIRNVGLGGIGLLDRNQRGDPGAVAFNVRISRNIVSNTNASAIDLFPGAGPNPNDPGDGDDGANTLLNTPVITTANDSVVSGTAQGGSTVEVFLASRPAGQFGLPIEFLGSTVAAGNGTWSLPVNLDEGDRVTALQIRPDNNTSELSVNVLVGEAPPPPPPPEPGDVIASDDFGRTVANGWGTAPEGGAWSVSGDTSNYSVGNGAGRMSVPAGQARDATLGVNATDVVITGQVAFDRVPSSSNAFAYVLARTNAAATSGYRAQFRVASNGAVFLMLRRSVNGAEAAVANEVAVPGLTASGGAPIAFRFEVVGNGLRLRAWSASGTEPSTWQTTATDTSLTAAGGAGLRAYTGSGVPNGPVTVSLDNFEVRLP